MAEIIYRNEKLYFITKVYIVRCKSRHKKVISGKIKLSNLLVLKCQNSCTMFAIGFQKTSNSAKYSWYSGTLSGSSKYASKTLVGSTAYYKPYLTNNNATVSITTLGSSYYFYE